MQETPYYIEVSKKSGLPDGRATALLDSTQDLGIESVEAFLVGQLYILHGRLSEQALKTVCDQLLCDPIAEDARVGEGHLPGFEGCLTAKVTYLPGVTDAVAGTVIEALAQLGVEGVSGVASGMVYHLFAPSSLDTQSIRTIAERILANPVIQNYEVYDSDGHLVMKG